MRRYRSEGSPLERVSPTAVTRYLEGERDPDHSDMSDDPDTKTPEKDHRQTRLAEALRANLRKRKAQARARRKGEQRGSDKNADQG
jgi:hypothetical protein